jgi:peptidoglycan/LPS O-acetylase OafA/YrhL
LSVVQAARRDRSRPAERPRRFAHVSALDGLRGLAVSLVVIYHFLPDRLPAGFLGVDVFFVLSGFLITSLALGEHHGTGLVSASAFFARRARRLLPAAITTIVVTVAIAIALDPASYRSSLRGQAVASLLYVNNWWAIAQNDTYRAVFGAESPLTHFWSLSIEEQFYIAFPFVLLGLVAVLRLRGGSTRALAGTLLALAGVGAVASAVEMALLYDPFQEPSRLYYGTDTRVQAVLIGVVGGCAAWLWRDGVLGRVPAWAWSTVAAGGTAALVVASERGGFLQGWLYRGGFFAIALAALAVVLSVVQHRGPVARAFELRPLVTLGLFSYGIYLWHWPVKVFLDEHRTGLSGVSLLGLRLAVTAAATWLSFRLVERPFRSPRTGAESPRMVRAMRSPRGAILGVAGVVAAVVAVWVIARPVTVTYANSVADAPSVATVSPAALGPLRVMWMGDSVAWTLGGGRVEFPQPATYETVFAPDQVTLWNLGRFACTMLVAPSRSFGEVMPESTDCAGRETRWPQQVADFHPDAVVWNGALFDTTEVYVDGRWIAFGTPEWDGLYLESLDGARVAATVDGARFVILGQNDPVPNPDEPFREALRPQNVWRFGHLRDLQRSFAEQHPADTRYIDLQALLCPGGPCPTTSPDGVVYRPDGVHWVVDGAREVAPKVTAALYQALDRALPH